MITLQYTRWNSLCDCDHSLSFQLDIARAEIFRYANETVDRGDAAQISVVVEAIDFISAEVCTQAPPLRRFHNYSRRHAVTQKKPLLCPMFLSGLPLYNHQPTFSSTDSASSM